MTLYAIVHQGKWVLETDKRRAIRIAKQLGGASVYSRKSVPEVIAWDWPTFAIGATKIR
jgi:hypothetical protein